MIKGKKGQVFIARMMLGVIVFIFALAFAQPIVENVGVATNASNLDCDNTSLSAAQNTTCVAVETGGVFYFISVLIALSIGVVTGKKSVTGLMTSIFVFIITIVMITPLKDLITLIRDTNHLSCGVEGISTAAGLACIVADFWLFWFIATVLATVVTIAFNSKVAPRIGLGKE